MQTLVQRWQNTRHGCRAEARRTDAGSRSETSRRPSNRKPADADGQGDHHASGDRQIKALFVSAGNPSSRCPTATNSRPRVRAAGPVWSALDFYVTETTAHCDYVLPGDDDVRTRGFPVHVPGASRPRRSGRRPKPSSHLPARRARNGTSSTTWQAGWAACSVGCLWKALGALGSTVNPRLMIDGLIRMSEGGEPVRSSPRRTVASAVDQQHPHESSCRHTCAPVSCAMRSPIVRAEFGWRIRISRARSTSSCRARHPTGFRCG